MSDQIMLAGRLFPVKPLVWKQLRIVLPAFAKLNTARVQGLTTESLDLMADIVFAAINTTGMLRDELDEMPITQLEMTQAVLVVAQQAGMRQDGAPGEATPPSTSTT